MGLFLMLGVDVLFVALFPVQLSSLKVVLFICFVAPLGNIFCQFLSEYHKNLNWKKMNRFHIGHHWMAAAFTCISYMSLDFPLPFAPEVLESIHSVPLPVQADIVNQLQDSLLVKGLL